MPSLPFWLMASSTRYFTPLLPLAVIFQSQANSKLSNSSSVTMSVTFLPPTHSRTPSLATQCSAGKGALLKDRHPLVVLPSNNSFHPAAFSLLVSVLGAADGAGSLLLARAGIASRAQDRAKSTGFMAPFLPQERNREQSVARRRTAGRQGATPTPASWSVPVPQGSPMAMREAFRTPAPAGVNTRRR